MTGGRNMLTWYLLGIQLMLELKKNGSTIYLFDWCWALMIEGTVKKDHAPCPEHLQYRT